MAKHVRARRRVSNTDTTVPRCRKRVFTAGSDLEGDLVLVAPGTAKVAILVLGPEIEGGWDTGQPDGDPGSVGHRDARVRLGARNTSTVSAEHTPALQTAQGNAKHPRAGNNANIPAQEPQCGTRATFSVWNARKFEAESQGLWNLEERRRLGAAVWYNLRLLVAAGLRRSVPDMA
eukprot:570732-Rhodomonas_salina.2